MGAHGEAFLHPFPTAAPVLGCRRWWYGFHSLPGACCLASEDLTEAIPPSVLNRLVEASFCAGSVVLIAAIAVRFRLRTTAQVADRQVFQIDGM